MDTKKALAAEELEKVTGGTVEEDIAAIQAELEKKKMNVGKYELYWYVDDAEAEELENLLPDINIKA